MFKNKETFIVRIMNFEQLNEDVILLILQFWPRRFNNITRKIVNRYLDDCLYITNVKEPWLIPEGEHKNRIVIKKSIFPLSYVLRNVIDLTLINCVPSFRSYVDNNVFVQVKRSIKTIINQLDKNYFPGYRWTSYQYPLVNLCNIKNLCKIYLENSDTHPPDIQHLQPCQVCCEEFIKIVNLPSLTELTSIGYPIIISCLSSILYLKVKLDVHHHIYDHRGYMFTDGHEVWVRNINPLVEYVHLEFEDMRGNESQKNFENFFDITLEDDENIGCYLEEFICDDNHITSDMMRILKREGLR
jgi:hypothetical protein